VKVVSGLRDPLGIAWYGNSLYVASIGRVDRFAGFDGTHFTRHMRVSTDRSPVARTTTSRSAPTAAS
jgi:hypothetical protein